MQYSNPSAEALAQREAMNALRSRGVATVVIHFSGGNDSGGADSMEPTDADGNPVELPNSSAHQGTEYNNATGRWEPGPWTVYERGSDGRPVKRDATDEEILWGKVTKVLEAPIYDRWGSFAGEFDVDGTLTWDVATGTHKLKGQESVTSWQSFEY